MLDPYPTTRLSISESLEILGSLGLKEFNFKNTREINPKSSCEFGTATLDERKVHRSGVNSYQLKGFSNKFIPDENSPERAIQRTFGMTLPFSEGTTEPKHKMTKTETTKLEYDEGKADQLEEVPKELSKKTEDFVQRTMVYKTLSNIKTKSTFVEGNSMNRPPPGNTSLVFANDSLLRVHKGSSDLYNTLNASRKSSFDK